MGGPPEESCRHFQGGQRILHPVRPGDRQPDQRARGGEVFLDLKFHDIPNTVARASEAAVDLGVSIFNLHALGGKKMMEEAVGAVRKADFGEGSSHADHAGRHGPHQPERSGYQSPWFSCSAEELALKLARSAREAGMSGVVASPREAARSGRPAGTISSF